jgi:hypothetical protein
MFLFDIMSAESACSAPESENFLCCRRFVKELY